jgi:hypothetical protein
MFRDDFEVSCPELDQLVEAALKVQPISITIVLLFNRENLLSPVIQATGRQEQWDGLRLKRPTQVYRKEIWGRIKAALSLDSSARWTRISEDESKLSSTKPSGYEFEPSILQYFRNLKSTENLLEL